MPNQKWTSPNYTGILSPRNLRVVRPLYHLLVGKARPTSAELSARPLQTLKFKG